MTTNSEQIVQQIRTEFDNLLQWVMGQELTSPTADAVERALLQRLLDLGRDLLRLFFLTQAQRLRPAAIKTAQGQTLPYHSQQTRRYQSVFGVLEFARSYYYRGGQGAFALDATLNLPTEQEGDVLHEWRTRLTTVMPYADIDPWLNAMLGARFPTSSSARQAGIAADGPRVSAYYDQAPPPETDPAATILVAQADGKGIPLRQPTEAAGQVRLGKGQKRACKKEAIVTAAYTLAPRPRTPEAVLASLFEPASHEPTRPPENRRPCGLHLWATLEGKEAACTQLSRHLKGRDGKRFAHRVALTDGSEALQAQVRAALPDFTLVLDLIHAVEYLWKAANAVLGETHSQRLAWVKTCAQQLLGGHVRRLIAALRVLAAQADRSVTQREVLSKVAAYYERNQEYMHYDRYLAAGWPIATGVIEGACRSLVKERFELSGMRWSQSGAEALLPLCSVCANGDWDAFAAYRREQRQKTQYAGLVLVEGEDALQRSVDPSVSPLRLAA
jgi:hypothetical protein